MTALSKQLWNWYEAADDVEKGLRQQTFLWLNQRPEAHVIRASDVALSADVSLRAAENLISSLAKFGVIVPNPDDECPICHESIRSPEGAGSLCPNCGADLFDQPGEVGWVLAETSRIDGFAVSRLEQQQQSFAKLTTALAANHVFFVKLDLMKSTFFDKLQDGAELSVNGIGNLAKDFLWRRLLPAAEAASAFSILLAQVRGDDATLIFESSAIAVAFLEHFAGLLHRERHRFESELRELGAQQELPELRSRAHLLVLPREDPASPQYDIRITGDGTIDVNGLPRTHAERIASKKDTDFEGSQGSYSVALYVAEELRDSLPPSWQDQVHVLGEFDVSKNKGEGLSAGLVGLLLPILVEQT